MTTVKTKFKETVVGHIPAHWNILSMGQIADIKNGKTNSVDAVSDGPFPLFDRSSVIKKSNKYLFDAESIIIPGEGKEFIPRYYHGKFDLHQRAYAITPKTKQCSGVFLYYWLTQYSNIFSQIATGSTVKSLRMGMLTGFPVAIPPINEQRQIAEILSSLDDKIELNRRINANLESVASALFKKWFVDIGDELPNEWRITKLGEFFTITTGKKDANVSTGNGQYPFFTCSQNILKTDEYSFNASAILLAGNGDFNVKWYEGKFEAYQRTYILTPHKKDLLGFLYYIIKYFLNDITAGHRGSVIRFITKGMIEDFKIKVPNEKILTEIARQFYEINQSIDFFKTENESIAAIKNLLLPKLMSGKLRV